MISSFLLGLFGIVMLIVFLCISASATTKSDPVLFQALKLSSCISGAVRVIVLPFSTMIEYGLISLVLGSCGITFNVIGCGCGSGCGSSFPVASNVTISETLPSASFLLTVTVFSESLTAAFTLVANILPLAASCGILITAVYTVSA